MSPISINYFRTIPTQLQLNGPILSFSTQPKDAQETTTAGVATFTGIATVAYADGSFPCNGTISYQWYYDGQKIYDTSVDPTSDASIETTGAASTITLHNISATDNGKIVYLEADYNPVGKEANAQNDPFKSDDAILSSFPEIVINTQPVDSIVGENNETTFTIDAEILPNTFNETLNYQWQLDGANLLNGTQDTNATVGGSGGKLTVTSDAGDNFEIDFLQLATFDDFVSDRTYTIKSDGDITTRVYAIGAGGGTSNVRSVQGGSGGAAQGITTFYSGQTYILRVGGEGVNGGSGGAGGFSGGGVGGGGHGAGGGGGGFTGLFKDSVSQANAIIIAGGAGGGSNDPATGGPGGGLEGSTGSNGSRAGKGGTQSGGGGGVGGGTPGSALQGGTGAAGGGGGYFGGGGGQYVSGCCADGAGGGGSGYLHPTLITSGEFSSTDAKPGGGPTQDGTFKISRVSSVRKIKATTSGVNTPTLTISSSDSGFAGIIRCVLTATQVENTTVISNDANFVSVPPRQLVNFEAYTFNNLYKSSSVDIGVTTSYTVDRDTFGTDYSIIQFHAPEKDVELALKMYGAQGSSSGSNSGGEGGYSSLNFTIQQNVEHTLIGISNNSGVFLYRGSNLIAVVGAGGNAGPSGRGGDGGGVNIQGEDAPGINGGDGGQIVPLTLNGRFGSIMEGTGITVQTGDIIDTAPTGGQTISCTKGSYWIDQAISACSNNSSSLIKYVNIDGTTITDSQELTRGFKPGYTITSTEGKGINNGGNGGAGSRGGMGGVNGEGGGGGSGFADGSISVIENTLGGNVGISSVEFSLFQTVTVIFTQFKSSTENVFVEFELDSGNGPSILQFGTRTGQIQGNLESVTAQIQVGSVYKMKSFNNADYLNASADGTQFTAADLDSNPGTLTITASRGVFDSPNKNDPQGVNITNFTGNTFTVTDISKTITQNVTDTKGTISAGSPFTVTRVIDYASLNPASNTEGHPIGSIKYVIDITGYTSITLSAKVLDTATRGSGLIASDNSIAISSGYPKQLSDTSFEVAFDMTNSTGPGRQATAVRSFSVTMTGDQT